MPIPAATLAATLAALAGMMALAWLVSLALRNASIVDVVWGPGFVLVGAVTWWLSGAAAARGSLVLALVTIWAARLAVHIWLRNRGKGEDFRYAAMRQKAGRRFAWVSLFQVFWLQAVLLWVVSHPIQAALSQAGQAALTWVDGAGLAIWVAGFAFEAVGDAQLARFRANPAHRGRVMRHGLWAWTRHPNYFGEALMAWGIFLFALGVPAGWLTIYSPALMTFLLVRVSGVRLLESTLLETKSGYREYAAQVSAFLPRPPRRRGG